MASPRFRDIKVGEFTYEFNNDREHQQQFAAMTFLLPENAYDSNDSKPQNSSLSAALKLPSLVGAKTSSWLSIKIFLRSCLLHAMWKIFTVTRMAETLLLLVIPRVVTPPCNAATKVPANAKRNPADLLFRRTRFYYQPSDSPEYKRIGAEAYETYSARFLRGHDVLPVASHTALCTVTKLLLCSTLCTSGRSTSTSAGLRVDQEISSRALKIADSLR